MMSMKVSHIFKTLYFFLCRILSKNPKVFHHNVSGKYKNINFFSPSSFINKDLSKRTLIFNLEGALLRSSFPFPYFMLVAFEAGSLIRAIILLLLYPIIYLVNEEMGLNIMVMVSFFGIKKESFRVGSSVLPKFFLEDVGLDMFEFLKRGGKKVGVSEYFPRVMIESFLRDYLEIDVVVGRELKVCCGFFMGVFEEEKNENIILKEEVLGEGRIGFELIGITSCFKTSIHHQIFSLCKEIYMVKVGDRRSWEQLPRDKYPNPLIFHDGRLAFKPTPSAILVMFLWVPLGFLLFIFRTIISISLPYSIAIPILGYSGIHLTLTLPESPKTQRDHNKGQLYVCNHKTLFDPLFVAYSLQKNMIAVTYSLSKMSEIISPIRTVRLTRNRDKDGQMMERLLNEGDLVVCPEGTTCREPYLLRFSPLFSEMSGVITPVAMNMHVSMFYGTTASGLKCLDPILFLMNPMPSYTVRMLESVSGSSASTCQDLKSSFHVANYVQGKLGEALGFECTKLTRKDKYMILAGNEGLASNDKYIVK